MKQTIFAFSFTLAALTGISAQAMPQDYFFPIYGAKAKALFDKLPKLTPNCAYAQNEVDASGNLVDSLKMVISHQQINSVLCQRVGEQAYACEATTLWNDSACK